MLLKCSYVIELWNQVWQWNTDVGGNDYNLSDSMEIAGDIANNLVFNIIILRTKKPFTIVKLNVNYLFSKLKTM